MQLHRSTNDGEVGNSLASLTLALCNPLLPPVIPKDGRDRGRAGCINMIGLASRLHLYRLRVLNDILSRGNERPDGKVRDDES